MLWNMSLEQLLTSFSFICTFAFISGWFADRIMGYAGFGPVGNWLVLLFGSYIGMYGFNSSGHMFHWNPPLTVAVVGGVACTLLIISAILKSMVGE